MTRITLWLAQHQLKSKKPAQRLRALQRLRTALHEAVVSLDDKITIALLDHTLADPETEIRQEAAGILGDLKDVRALPPLIRALSDRSEAVQETAVKGLKQLDDRAAIAALVPKLSASASTVQWQAALALKSLGWRPKTESEQIHFFVALGEFKQLVNFGPAAVRPLVAVLASSASSKKIAAAKTLGEIGDPAAVRSLQMALRDADSLVRSAAVYAIERAGFREAAPSLVLTLKDSVRNVRLAAALALGSIGDAQTVEPLIKALDDKDWEIRHAALESLGKLGDTRAFPSVARHLDDKENEVREVAADALVTVGNESIVEKLVFTLVDAHSGVRQAATRALNCIYPHWEKSERVKKLLPDIQAAMKHHDVNVQNAATSLFQRVAGPSLSQSAVPLTPPRTPPAVLLLRELLRAAEVEFRVVAAEIIGRMNLKDCEADLKTALNDAADAVKQAAQAALNKLAATPAASGQSKVMFLTPTATAPESATPVLLCSMLGEVLHQRNCPNLAGWLQTLEFLLPQAEKLGALMTLGETRRLTIRTPTERLVIVTTPEASIMLQTSGGERAEIPGATGQSGATHLEVLKEQMTGWMRRTPSARGVLMRGIRFPDQTILCDVDSVSLPAVALEEAYHLAADSFDWLQKRRMTTTHLVWGGERSELHCALRPDRCVLGVMASAHINADDLPAVNQQLAEFRSLAVEETLPPVLA
jgi:HEAT repeat protein